MRLPLIGGRAPLRGARHHNPDGRWLAVGCSDAGVRLFRCPRERSSRPSRCTKERVRGVAFSPDGTLLATASNDKPSMSPRSRLRGRCHEPRGICGRRRRPSASQSAGAGARLAPTTAPPRQARLCAVLELGGTFARNSRKAPASRWALAGRIHHLPLGRGRVPSTHNTAMPSSCMCERVGGQATAPAARHRLLHRFVAAGSFERGRRRGRGRRRTAQAAWRVPEPGSRS